MGRFCLEFGSLGNTDAYGLGVESQWFASRPLDAAFPNGLELRHGCFKPALSMRHYHCSQDWFHTKIPS